MRYATVKISRIIYRQSYFNSITTDLFRTRHITKKPIEVITTKNELLLNNGYHRLKKSMLGGKKYINIEYVR